MPNKFYNNLSSKGGGKAGGGNQAGTVQSSAMPMKSADYPGLPGQAGPDRSGGTSKTGFCGMPFQVKQKGF